MVRKVGALNFPPIFSPIVVHNLNKITDMNKKILIPLILILLSGCVSKKEFVSLNNEYNQLTAIKQELNSKNEELNKIVSEKNNEIDSLKLDNSKLKSKVEKLTNDFEELNNKYEEATRTADYYYKQGIDLLQNKEYKSAQEKFEIVINKYPTNKLANSAKSKLTVIQSVSKKNYNLILSDIKNLELKAKLTTIENKRSELFLIPSDSLKLNSTYDQYLSQYEAEKYISIKDDKMQSCYFYESTRNTDQKVGYDNNLRFALYIVKNYNGRKYFRLRTRYHSDDWMFYEKVTIRGSNGVQFTVETEYPEKQTESSGYGVSEWSDNYLDNSLNWKIYKIAEADEVCVRYDGKYRHDMTLNEEQMKAFREIVAKYKKL